MTAHPNDEWVKLRAAVAEVVRDPWNRLTPGDAGDRLVEAVVTAVQPFLMSGSAVMDSTGSRALSWREMYEHRAEELVMCNAWRVLVQHLNRCEHGRHEGDPCAGTSGCNGLSKGNPLWAIGHASDQTRVPPVDACYDRLWVRFGGSREWPARLLGFGMDGVPIVVPKRQTGVTPTPADYYRTEQT